MPKQKTYTNYKSTMEISTVIKISSWANLLIFTWGH